MVHSAQTLSSFSIDFCQFILNLGLLRFFLLHNFLMFEQIILSTSAMMVAPNVSNVG